MKEYLNKIRDWKYTLPLVLIYLLLPFLDYSYGFFNGVYVLIDIPYGSEMLLLVDLRPDPYELVFGTIGIPLFAFGIYSTFRRRNIGFIITLIYSNFLLFVFLILGFIMLYNGEVGGRIIFIILQVLLTLFSMWILYSFIKHKQAYLLLKSVLVSLFLAVMVVVKLYI